MNRRSNPYYFANSSNSGSASSMTYVAVLGRDLDPGEGQELWCTWVEEEGKGPGGRGRVNRRSNPCSLTAATAEAPQA